MGQRGRPPRRIEIDLRRIRAEHGFSTNDVAKAWGVSWNYVYMLESMRAVPVNAAEKYRQAVAAALAAKAAAK